MQSGSSEGALNDISCPGHHVVWSPGRYVDHDNILGYNEMPKNGLRRSTKYMIANMNIQVLLMVFKY